MTGDVRCITRGARCMTGGVRHCPASVGVKVRGIEVLQQRFDARGATGQVLSDQRSQHQALGALMCIQQPDTTFDHSSETQPGNVYTEVEQGWTHGRASTRQRRWHASTHGKTRKRGASHTVGYRRDQNQHTVAQMRERIPAPEAPTASSFAPLCASSSALAGRLGSANTGCARAGRMTGGCAAWQGAPCMASGFPLRHSAR